MQEVTGKKYLTIQAQANTDYAVKYSYEQYVDLLNNTGSALKISNDEIDSDNYAVVPAGGAYNDIRIDGGTLYITVGDNAGEISLIAR